MAKVWKKLQRADSAFEGNVTGTVDGTAAGTVKTGATAGTAAKVVTDAAFDGSNKLNVANANDGLKNSETTKTDVGLENVANESPTTLKSTMSLNNVANETRATILGGNLTGTVDGTAVGTVKSGAASGATANQDTTSAILGGNLTGTVDGTAVATVKSGAAKGTAAPVTFRQDGIPTALNAGDVWFDTNDGNKQYRATATGDDAITSGEWESVVPSKGAVGLGNVTNASQATIQAATLSAADADDVGLGNVDNTSDAGKPVSTAQATSIATKAPTASPTFTGTVAGVTKTHVGLSAVDNTSDAGKPVSTAQATSIATKAPTANPTFTGTVGGVTSTHVGLGSVSNITTSAMREGVTKANVGLTSVIDQAITVASGKLKLDNVAQTMDADTIDGDSKATVKAAAVSTAETNIIGGAPGALQTLDALAAALGDDASFNSTVTTSIATKGKAPMTLTAEDVDGDSTYDNDPTSEALGQIGIYSGQAYQVMDI